MSNKTVYIFRDHYKQSSDPFRNIVGLYHDLENNQLKTTETPKPSLLLGASWSFGPPQIINTEGPLLKQRVIFKPANTEANRQFLQSHVIENEGDADNTRAFLDFGIRNDATMEEVIKAILSDNSKLYRDINFKIPKLSQTSDVNQIRIESNYNFFVEKYEKHIQNPIIPEEVLPNFYVFSLALDRSILDSVSQKDYNASQVLGVDSPYDSFMSKFDTFITLDNNILLNPSGQSGQVSIFFAIALLAYLERYAEVYDSVSINFIETMRKRFGSLFANIPNQELINKLNQFKMSYPMYIELMFATPLGSAFLDFLIAADLTIESFTSFVNERLLVEINSTQTTGNPTPPGGFVIFSGMEPAKIVEVSEGETLEKAAILFLHDVETLIRTYINELIEGQTDIQQNISENSNGGFTFLDGNQVGLPDQVLPLDRFLSAITAIPKFNDLMRASIRSYKDIIDGKLAKPEILYFRIEKKDKTGKIIQNFCLPNIPDVSIQNFIDTQVKYNKEYRYKIWAGTLSYGTEYYYQSTDPQALLMPVQNEATPG